MEMREMNRYFAAVASLLFSMSALGDKIAKRDFSDFFDTADVVAEIKIKSAALENEDGKACSYRYEVEVRNVFKGTLEAGSLYGKESVQVGKSYLLIGKKSNECKSAVAINFPHHFAMYKIDRIGYADAAEDEYWVTFDAVGMAFPDRLRHVLATTSCSIPSTGTPSVDVNICTGYYVVNWPDFKNYLRSLAIK